MDGAQFGVRITTEVYEMLRRSIALLTILLTAAACGDSLGPDSFTGTYELETVNGSDLPFGVLGIEITDGSITLRSDGTYTGRTRIRFTENGQARTQEQTEQGTFERVGNSIELDSDLGVQTDAMLSGRTLTIQTSQLVSVYRR
jgi:hypothetical protein